MNIFEELEILNVPEKTFVDELPNGIYEYALQEFEMELDSLYYPDLIILPLTPKGELERIRMCDEWVIFKYGAYEYNFEFKGEMYLAILINND